MKKAVVSVLAAAALMLYGTAAMAQAEKAKILKPCSQCHKPEDKTLRGMIGNVSQKAETFSINAGAVWNVKFDDNTKIIGWQGPLHKIPKEKEIAVKFIRKDGEVYAESVSVKQPAKLSPEKLLTVEQMADHVEKGDAVIIDSRPAARFYEGAIPGAINIYDAEFDKHIDRLPKDKNALLVFYCAGPT
jgi:cytochrome c551/c552